uniref:polysaccharide pyruvyl transferase family protein n=1 Tax=Acetatifactor sp. TaxID=1872090 RepID=UPI004057032A
MKVTLLGLEFASANLGCEALAYSFANELTKVSTELGISVDFTAVLFDLKPDITVPCSGQKIECLKIRYKKVDFWRNLVKLFKESDLIFDFTGGDSFSDIYGKKRFYMATLIKMLAIRSKTPFILGPQTYGPYQRKLVKAFAKKVIRDSSYVFARDEVSQKYAAELSGRDVKIAADVAFALPYENQMPEASDKLRIGINPSGLLWNGGYNHAKLPLTVEYQRYCTELLEALLKDTRNEVYLISHVGTKKTGEVESDYAVCNLLHERYPETILVDVFDTPMDAKSFISGMDVLIAARMHATIAAFSAGAATIPFSYSRKFEGLYNSVNYDCVIHACSDTTENAVEQTLQYVENREDLKKDAAKAMKKILTLQSGFEADLRNIITENVSF